LASSEPAIAVTAVRTGCGKSQVRVQHTSVLAAPQVGTLGHVIAVTAVRTCRGKSQVCWESMLKVHLHMPWLLLLLCVLVWGIASGGGAGRAC
jgi:predicted GTPase